MQPNPDADLAAPLWIAYRTELIRRDAHP